MPKPLTMSTLQRRYELYLSLGLSQAAEHLGLSHNALTMSVYRYRQITGKPSRAQVAKQTDLLAAFQVPHEDFVPLPQPLPTVPAPTPALAPEIDKRSPLWRKIHDLEKRIVKLEQTRRDPEGFVPSSRRLQDGGVNREKQRQSFRRHRVPA